MNRTSMISLVFLGALVMIPAPAQTTSCRATLSADAQLVANDLSAIAAQANSQGFTQAVQTLAHDLEQIVPTLNVPDQQLVEKFLTDLTNATSSTGPGGTAITTTEKIVLANDLNQILVSTGITSAQISTLATDINAVMAALNGISTAQLQADLQKMVADAKACKPR